MSAHRPANYVSPQRGDAFDPTIRLDHTHNPYGPCPAAIEAVEACLESPLDSLAGTFRRRLGEVYRVPVGSIRLFESVVSAIHTLASRHPGPIIAFPPSATANLIAESRRQSDIVSIARGTGGDSVVGPECASDIPANGLAIIDSPSNPLGSIVSPADAVRLARACGCVVIDERFAEFSEFSLLPLARELDNVIVMRSFASWAGLAETSCAWAVAPPGLAEASELAATAVRPEAIAGAMATLENQA